jgi:hypothetical protein
MKWATTVAAFLSLAYMTACNGGGTVPDPVPLDTTLNGTVTIIGAPLADLVEPSETGSQDDAKWAVRLIDPTEDVDSITLVNDDDTFASSDIDNAGDYLLNVQVLPAVDLAGGADSTTPVELSIPLSVTEGATTALVADISFLAPQAVSALHGVSQLDTSYRIRLHYSISGAVSAHELIEIHWQNGVLRRDTNNDGLVSDEAQFPDSNRNGISDSLDQFLRETPDGQPYTVRGIITELNLSSGVIHIDDQAVLVNEATRIQQGIRSLRLEQLQIGDNVTVNGSRHPDGRFFAQTIHVTHAQGQQPPSA